MTNISIYSDLAGAPYIKPAGMSHPEFNGKQGDLVGFDSEGQVVHATADASGNGSEAGGPIACRGALFPDHVTDTDSLSDDPRYQATDLWIKSNDTLAGTHRISMVEHGFIVQNEDQDWGFDPTQPVLLGASGGLTQTASSTTGDIVQAVGYVAPIDRVPVGEAVWMNPDTDFSTV
jgi:hypothetical protein